MIYIGAANGIFAVRIAPLQKANPKAALDFLYRARMVSASIDRYAIVR